MTAERARKTELEGLNSRLTQDRPYCPSPKEGCNEGVEPSTVNRIKEAPTYLHPLPLESAPPDTSPPLSTDPISSLLKPEFTGQHTQEPTPTDTQSTPTPDQPQTAALPTITPANPNLSSLPLGPTSTSQLTQLQEFTSEIQILSEPIYPDVPKAASPGQLLSVPASTSQHAQLQKPAPSNTQSPLPAPLLSTLGPREKRKREHHEEVEINKGRGNINRTPNPKRARLGESKLNQENLTDKSQASEECKLEESKEVNIDK